MTHARRIEDVQAGVVDRQEIDDGPFGAEIVAGSAQDPTERMRFTGHERDHGRLDSGGDDLDYMHARYYNPGVARFLSVDPGADSVPEIPQSWNRYAYVRSNPMRSIDPTGMYIVDCAGAEQCKQLSAAFEEARVANLRSADPETRRSAQAYGARDEDNGVVVEFASKAGQLDDTRIQNPGFDRSSGAFRAKMTVTLDPTLSGVQLESVVGHEGVHVFMTQDFVASIDQGTGNYDPSANPARGSSETRAFEVQERILLAGNGSITLGRGNAFGNRSAVSFGVGATGTVHARIHRILTDPAYRYLPKLEQPLVPMNW